MSMPTEQEMRNAISTRDKSFDGLFVYGVVTTGVFCRPACSSRAAKAENLRFFSGCKAAMLAGFRPCKRCQPEQATPDVQALVAIARHIEAHADESLPLRALAEIACMSAPTLQKKFKTAFGISPKAYQDAVRMRRFKQSLKAGNGVTDAIFETGYGSVSRVYGEANRNIGMTPKAYRAGGEGEIINYACRQTVLGLMVMASTDKGICFVQFGEDETSLATELAKEFPKATIRASSAQNAPQLDTWMEALDQHISDGMPRPDLPLDIRGTAFQMKVWQFLLSIREGEVLSYSELAANIDKPKAIRAVATACASNRIGVLIPCHRVLRGDGSLGGYRWGLERKRALLDAERQRKEEPDDRSA